MSIVSLGSVRIVDDQERMANRCLVPDRKCFVLVPASLLLSSCVCVCVALRATTTTTGTRCKKRRCNVQLYQRDGAPQCCAFPTTTRQSKAAEKVKGPRNSTDKIRVEPLYSHSGLKCRLRSNFRLRQNFSFRWAVAWHRSNCSTTAHSVDVAE